MRRAMHRATTEFAESNAIEVGGTRYPTSAQVAQAVNRGELDPAQYISLDAQFVKQAILRYGPRGTFWTENPTLPRKPLRTWQVWNEPNFKYFVAKPNPAEYGRLVKLDLFAGRSEKTK